MNYAIPLISWIGACQGCGYVAFTRLTKEAQGALVCWQADCSDDVVRLEPQEVYLAAFKFGGHQAVLDMLREHPPDWWAAARMRQGLKG